jgi:putative transposase
MKYTYQYRLLPTTDQKITLNRWLRVCRFWFNRQLGERFEWWEHSRCAVSACPLICHLPELKEKPNYYSQKKQLPILKQKMVTVNWSGEELNLSEVPSLTLQEVCKRVEKAFSRYLSGDSNGKKSGKPRFKSSNRFRHQKIARARIDHAFKTAHKLLRTGKQVFFHEKLNLQGLSRKNQPVQDDNGKYLPNGQSAKSGLNKSWADAAFGQFFSIFNYIAEKAGVAVIDVNPAYTSQLLCYRDEFVFTDRSIREYWDEIEQVLVDRDINAAINIKRVGLDEFPTIKRRKGKPVVVDSNTDFISKEVLSIFRDLEKPASYL